MEDIEKQTYTVYGIMKILGIGRDSTCDPIAKKELSVVKVGRALCVSKSPLDDWLNKQKSE